MEMANNDLRRNAEGYSDPTAYEAIKNLDADDERFHKLLNTIFTICELSGVSFGGADCTERFADRKSLEVIFMGEGVRETICTSCVHREVCVYKQTYLEYLGACEKMRGDYPDDISFIKKNDPDCNFYKKKSDVNLR